MSNDSFIREVEEELRSDKMKSFWDRFGPFIIGGAVLIAVGTGATVFYNNYTQSQASASGDRFLEALTLANEGDASQALDVLAALENDGYGQYPVLARMRAATVRQAQGDAAAAVADFDRIAADSSVPVALRDIARLRAAYILVDSGAYADVAARAEQLTTNTNPFRHAAREALGLAAWKAERYEDAQRLFNEVISDASVPQALAQRARIMLDMITSTGKVAAG